MEVRSILRLSLHTGADPRSTDDHHNQHDCPHNHDDTHHCPLFCSLSQRCKQCHIQPGTHTANPEPNMEDISVGRKSQVDKLKKKVMSDRVCDKEASKFIKREQSKSKIGECDKKQKKKTSI